MKLLIVTQVVDTQDPVLGFFVRWIEEFAKHANTIEVICLREGEHSLGENIRVHSLGKERGAASRGAYAWRFLKLALSLRKNYDVVFVHMNQEYLLLAGWLWGLLGKRMYMWRNHYAGNVLTDIAAAFCTKVFCTSTYSYTAKYKKTVLMPVGIDTEVFKPQGEPKPLSILFLARMSPSKRPDLLLEALGQLAKKGIKFSASFYGSPLPQDVGYFEQMKLRALELNLSSLVVFNGAVAHAETPAIYRAHEFFVNASRSGMYDKTIFEAMASGTLPLVCNKDLAEVVESRFIFEEGNVDDLAQKLERLLSLSLAEKKRFAEELRVFVDTTHSLKLLGTKVIGALHP
jgi:glycosyltransferase involved in cell wall biosynthesis